MADLLYVVMFIAVTALGVLFVIGCDRIVGPDDPELAEEAVRDKRELEEIVA
jgi:hypothetical protein